MDLEPVELSHREIRALLMSVDSSILLLQPAVGRYHAAVDCLLHARAKLIERLPPDECPPEPQ